MDYWIIKAEAKRANGSAGTLSVKFHERDSESSSQEECMFRLQMAASKYGVEIIGPMTVIADDAEYEAAKQRRIAKSDGQQMPTVRR